MRTRRTFGRDLLAATALAGWKSRGGLFADAISIPSSEFRGAASLRAHAAARSLYVGSAVNTGLLEDDSGYRRTVVEQCNIISAENAMKWAALRPGPEQFDFALADRFVAFAEANGIAVRGHNLCWHEALPTWFTGTVNRDNAEQFLTAHIAAVAGRYQGKIRSWDVVNEAISLADNEPGGMRNGPWYKVLGPRFIDIAFRAARAADPRTLLTYNDYGIETDGAADTAKRAAVLALLARMKHDGVPLDAVGIQSHLSVDSGGQIGSGLNEFLKEAARLGLKVFITELDVNDDSIGEDNPKKRGEQVAALYRNYVGMLLGNRAVTDVLSWGISDGSSWLNAPGAKFRARHSGREETLSLIHI